MKDRQIFDGSGARYYLAAQLEEKKAQVRFKGIESTFKLVTKSQIELGDKSTYSQNPPLEWALENVSSLGILEQ